MEPRWAPDVGSARFNGLLLMAIGGMIALLCGSCTYAVVSPAVSEMLAVARGSSQFNSQLGYDEIFLSLAPAMGVLPTILGVAIGVRGIAIYRWRRPPSAASEAIVAALAMAAGGATVWFAAIGVYVIATVSRPFTDSVMYGLVALACLLAGGALFWFGLNLYRRPRRPASRSPP